MRRAQVPDRSACTIRKTYGDAVHGRRAHRNARLMENDPDWLSVSWARVLVTRLALPLGREASGFGCRIGTGALGLTGHRS